MSDKDIPEKNQEKKQKEGSESRPKKKVKKWPWILLIIFATLTVGGYGFYEYSNTPGFCNNCHIMHPYYEAWETSSHSNVPCIDCHISPEKGAKWQKKMHGMVMALKYVTRTYGSKPFAEIEDASCMRSGCHEERLVMESATETFKNNVVFNHKSHLTNPRRGKELRCTSCHAQIVVGNHMEVTTTTCYLCHFKESPDPEVAHLSDCRLCHTQLPAEDVEHNVRNPHDLTEVVDTYSFNHVDYIGDQPLDCTSCHFNTIEGAGTARQDRCFVCHNDPEQLERFGDVDFLHKNHITEHNVTCQRCHDQVDHVVPQVGIGTVSNCTSCHSDMHFGQEEMYAGIGGKGVDQPMPSVMYQAMVDCKGCHVQGAQPAHTFSGYTVGTGLDGCEQCHADLAADYIDVYEMFKTDIQDQLASLKQSLSQAQARSGLSEAAKKSLEDAAYNIRFVEEARGWVHNWDYAGELLSAAEDMIAAAVQ